MNDITFTAKWTQKKTTAGTVAYKNIHLNYNTLEGIMTWKIKNMNCWKMTQ